MTEEVYKDQLVGPCCASRKIHTPLNENICDEIDPKMYTVLTALGFVTVLDMELFFEKNGRYPAINSIFWTKNGGGSYDYKNKEYGNITVYNGTLTHCSSLENWNWEELSNSYQEKKWGKQTCLSKGFEI